MNFSSKNNLYSHFLQQWHTQFRQVPFIIRYIKSYPQSFLKLDGCHLLDEEEVEASQANWLLLLEKFDHPLEKEFFKRWWVPLEKNRFGLYLDLSTPGFTLFQTIYFPFEPYAWTKKILFENMTEFLAVADETDNGADIQLFENEDEWQAGIDSLFKQNRELGLSGQIEPRPIEVDDLFSGPTSGSCMLKDDELTLKDVNAIILFVLPFNLKIHLNDFCTDEDLTQEVHQKVTDIQSLLFLIQSSGFLRVTSYEFFFVPTETGYVKWADNVFTIKYNDHWQLCHIRSKFETFRWFFEKSLRDDL